MIYVGKTNNTDFIDYFNKNLKNLLDTNVNKNLLMLSSIKRNLIVLLVIFIMSFSFIGPLATLLINLFKGFTLGFTGGFIINAMEIKGIKFLVYSVLPQNIFYIFALILASLYSMKFSFRKFSWNTVDDHMTIIRYSTYFWCFYYSNTRFSS